MESTVNPLPVFQAKDKGGVMGKRDELLRVVVFLAHTVSKRKLAKGFSRIDMDWVVVSRHPAVLAVMRETVNVPVSVNR